MFFMIFYKYYFWVTSSFDNFNGLFLRTATGVFCVEIYPYTHPCTTTVIKQDGQGT